MNIHDFVAKRILEAQAAPKKERDAKQYSDHLRGLLAEMSGGQGIVMLEPADRFDQCIIGVTVMQGRTRVIYNLNQLVVLVSTTLDVPLAQAMEVVNTQIGPAMDTAQHGAIFMTEVEDILQGAVMKAEAEALKAAANDEPNQS